MNKSAETLAEERVKKIWGNPNLKIVEIHYCKADFIAGHQSRDEEVKKLVEVLGELAKVAMVEIKDKDIFDKAKEALKPYQK